MTNAIYSNSSPTEVKNFCVAKGLLPSTSAPITRRAHAEHIRLLEDHDRDPKFHCYDDLPAEMRLQILRLVVDSQGGEDTQKLRLTSRAVSADVRKIQFETIPFLVTNITSHVPRRNEVLTGIHMNGDATGLDGLDGHNCKLFTIVQRTDLGDEEHHCPLDFVRYFPAQLKEHRKVAVILMIECPLASRTRVADFRQTSHLIFALVSFLRNGESTKCRNLQIDVTFVAGKSFVTPGVQGHTQDKPILSTDTLEKLLWSLQYLPVHISLTFTGLLPIGFNGCMFDGPRATFTTIPDSIAHYTALRVRFDLALETLASQSESDIARKAELEAAMHAVRLIGPSSNVSSTSDTAVCFALKHLEHLIDLNDLVLKGMRIQEESDRL